MFTLTLVRFTPLSNETHVVAVVLGILAFVADNIAMPGATITSSFATSLIAGSCWYVFKAFDGITYDGAETSIGTVTGLIVCAALCSAYFLL